MCVFVNQLECVTSIPVCKTLVLPISQKVNDLVYWILVRFRWVAFVYAIEFRYNKWNI